MNLDFLEQMFGKVPARQRQWHIDNNQPGMLMCKACQKVPVKWSVKNQRYSTYCCSKCANTDSAVKQKRANTCLVKYGASTNLSNEQNKQKVRQTCIDRYGVDNYSKTSQFHEKFKQTCIDRFGVENPSQSLEIKNRIDQTHQTRYGRKRASQQHLSESTIQLKNDKEYMLDLYQTQKMPLTEIAELLGVNHSQLCVHFKTNLGIDISRHSVSSHERQLLSFLTERGIRVESSVRNLIPPKEIDIWLPDYNIAIELNGLAWHSELRGKPKTYHLEKTERCAAQGIRLIHIWDVEWISQRSLVESRLLSILGFNRRIYARQCSVRLLTATESREFFECNHIQKNCVSRLTWGLEHNDQIVAAMSFGKPRFSKSAEWELLRFANLAGHTIVGGASRLFKAFISASKPQGTVISYCDRRWNTGNLYHQLGFNLVKVAGPNYWYITNYSTIEHRSKYQKHKLSKILSQFDPQASEWSNMQAHGYDRVWDCGNWVFEYT